MHTLFSSFAQFEERVKGLSLKQIPTPEGVACHGFTGESYALKLARRSLSWVKSMPSAQTGRANFDHSE